MTKLDRILVITLIIQAIILAYLIGKWVGLHALPPVPVRPIKTNTLTA